MILSHSSPRFLLRDNLGKLARELRFLGYDAAIYPHTSFFNALRLAQREKRILLTRSQAEAKTKTEVKCLLIKSNFWSQQLTEIIGLISFQEEFLFSRCAKCNKKLYEIDKSKIISIVPEYICQYHSEFRICRTCGSIYWQGDHYQDIKLRISRLFEEG
ncbi:MAG: Mut7-C RNAse domain-containing protein [Candidatus Cloacimonetes bacterium]|nr:Mut7-C RNAse domain-containing protein [Candidatus Cloacimonadota bacterium]